MVNHLPDTRVNDTPQRIWTALRISRTSDVAMLALQASCDGHDVRSYLDALTHAGYCVNEGGTGARQRYRLKRNSGPTAPRVDENGIVTDLNRTHRPRRKKIRPLRANVAPPRQSKPRAPDTRQKVWDAINASSVGEVVRADALAATISRNPMLVTTYLFELERGGFVEYCAPDFKIMRKNGPLAPRHYVRLNGTAKTDVLHDPNDGKDYPMDKRQRAWAGA